MRTVCASIYDEYLARKFSLSDQNYSRRQVQTALPFLFGLFGPAILILVPFHRRLYCMNPVPLLMCSELSWKFFVILQTNKETCHQNSTLPGHVITIKNTLIDVNCKYCTVADSEGAHPSCPLSLQSQPVYCSKCAIILPYQMSRLMAKIPCARQQKKVKVWTLAITPLT